MATSATARSSVAAGAVGGTAGVSSSFSGAAAGASTTAVRCRPAARRGTATIIKKHNGERHDRDRGPSAEQDIGDEPHETDLFAGEKLLSA